MEAYLIIPTYIGLSFVIYSVTRTIDRRRQNLTPAPEMKPDLPWLLAAMCLGPLVVTAVSGFTIVPLFALALGIVQYVFFGTLVMGIVLFMWPGTPFIFVLASLVTNAALFAVLSETPGLVAIAYEDPGMFGFALFFGALWAGISGWLYQRWCHRTAPDLVFE